jgi:hypothetical protein
LPPSAAAAAVPAVFKTDLGDFEGLIFTTNVCTYSLTSNQLNHIVYHLTHHRCLLLLLLLLLLFSGVWKRTGLSYVVKQKPPGASYDWCYSGTASLALVWEPWCQYLR